MPLLQIMNRSMVLFTQIDQYHALAICPIKYMLTTDSCVHHILVTTCKVPGIVLSMGVQRDVQRPYSQSQNMEKNPQKWYL